MSDTKIVVSTREENLYDDSYFYATFYNEGCSGLYEFSEVMIGSTAFSGGLYDMPITATEEIKKKYQDWLVIDAEYRNREIMRAGDFVYSPKARKYKSLGLVKKIVVDMYDSRLWCACVEFAEGTTWIRTNKLVKLQPFVNNYGEKSE